MTKFDDDLQRVFNHLNSVSIGFGSLFKDLQFHTSTFPPHNVKKVSENEIFIEIAVAGYKKSEIEMQEHQGQLTIKGEKVGLNDDGSPYQHKGIAGRSFLKTFQLAEYFEVNNATLEDGMLMIKLVKNIPESSKPKSIPIG